MAGLCQAPVRHYHCQEHTDDLASQRSDSVSPLYNLFPVLCRLAKSSNTDYRVLNGIQKLEAYFLHEDSANDSERRPFEEFHYHTLAALQKFLPSAPSQKRRLGESMEIGSATPAQPAVPDKRPRLDASTQDSLIAAIAQLTAVTKAFMSATPNLTGPTQRDARVPPVQHQRGFQPPGRCKPGGALNCFRGGFQRNNTPGKTPFPRRMCERCTMIDPDHREYNCPNPPDPHIADKLAKHKKYCNELKKRAAREHIMNQKADSGTQKLLSTNPGAEHAAHMANNFISDLAVDDPVAQLFPEDEFEGSWVLDSS